MFLCTAPLTEEDLMAGGAIGDIPTVENTLLLSSRLKAMAFSKLGFLMWSTSVKLVIR